MDVRLTLSPRLDPQKWEVRLQNASSFPIRLSKDPRLFWLGVTSPGTSEHGSCRLPNDLFPAASASLRTATLGPGEALAFSIDPLFYCFGKDKAKRLVVSANVTPHYGFPSARTSAVAGHLALSPVIASAVESAAAEPVGEITGEPIILDADVAPDLRGIPERTSASSGKLVLDMVRGSDARSERSVDATVRLTNTTARPIAVYLRRELLTFEVLGPDGSSTCTEQGEFRHPARLGYTKLSPHGSVTLTSRLVELCPRGTFADAGVYLIGAVFETEHDGETVGLRAFTGRLMTDHPVMVRVRHSQHLAPNHWVLPLATRTPAPPSAHSAAPPARLVRFRRAP